MNIVDIIPLADRDRWVNAHEGSGLPSQSWHYCSALAASGVGAKLARVETSGSVMLLPFFERRWMDTVDVCTVLGLSGASIDPPSSAPLHLWSEFAQAQGWIAGYIQLAPNLSNASLSPGKMAASNRIFILPVCKNPAAQWRDASANLRRKIRKASRSVELVDDRERLSLALLRLYPESMKRLGAKECYMHSNETLRRLTFMPDSLILGAERLGSISGVIIVLIAGASAEYFIGTTTAEERWLIAWLIAAAIDRLRDMGVTELNLGGGIRPGDGVYKFKEQFGVPYQYLSAIQQIYNPVRYDELCRASHVLDPDAWFPSYRAPPAVAI